MPTPREDNVTPMNKLIIMHPRLNMMASNANDCLHTVKTVQWYTASSPAGARDGAGDGVDQLPDQQA